MCNGCVSGRDEKLKWKWLFWVFFIAGMIIWILIQPGWIFAGHLKTIDDLPAWKNFVETSRYQTECGRISFHEYENSKVRWKTHFLPSSVSNKFSNPLLTIRFDRVTGEFEFWLDRDRDGHPDEYYSRKPDPKTNIYPDDVFFEKYPTPCDVLKK